MLLRYGTDAQGDVVRKARIYTSDEHGIPAKKIDRDAVWVCRKLAEAGHSAYIVGGAIRDLLLGDDPKDFDIATDALPGRIRKVFRRSRIIGRRFRLVHVYFRGGKTLEVSTFRAAGVGDSNVFGSLAEDVMRRDFSINALFYDPLKQQLVDYVSGFKDIKDKRLRTLTRPAVSFREDPVRMLRAIKYAAPHDLHVPGAIRRQIRRHKDLLLDCSPDRLTEEFFKILGSGKAARIIDMALRHQVFDVLFPRIAALVRGDETGWETHPLLERLRELDAKVRLGDPLERGDFVAEFYRDAVEAQPHDNTLDGIQSLIKSVAEPLRISNRDSRHAAHKLQKRHEPPTRKKRKRRRRRSRSKDHSEPRSGENQGSQRNVSMRRNKESTFSP